MRHGAIHKLAFIGKSLLWSLLLYFVSMAIINWDEVASGFHRNHGGNVAIVRIIPVPCAQPTAGTYTGNDNTPQINKDIQATGGIINTVKNVFQYINDVAGIVSK